MMADIDIVALLKSYSVCKKFLHSQEYAKEFFDPYGTHQIVEKELYEARVHIVESLIQLLEPSNEYTILHLHYIKGVPIEKCAECMSISRSTAFRMLKKAHKEIMNLVDRRADNEQREITDKRPQE